MNARAGLFERMLFLADVVTREASYLSQTDGRLFANVFGPAEVAGLPDNPDLGERVDAFVSRFGRLQDTLPVRCCRDCSRPCWSPSVQCSTT